MSVLSTLACLVPPFKTHVPAEGLQERTSVDRPSRRRCLGFADHYPLFLMIAEFLSYLSPSIYKEMAPSSPSLDGFRELFRNLSRRSLRSVRRLAAPQRPLQPACHTYWCCTRRIAGCENYVLDLPHSKDHAYSSLLLTKFQLPCPWLAHQVLPTKSRFITQIHAGR
jgi:hypothetical protein